MIRLQRISTADGFLYEYMEQLITAASRLKNTDR